MESVVRGGGQLNDVKIMVSHRQIQHGLPWGLAKRRSWTVARLESSPASVRSKKSLFEHGSGLEGWQGLNTDCNLHITSVLGGSIE